MRLIVDIANTQGLGISVQDIAEALDKAFNTPISVAQVIEDNELQFYNNEQDSLDYLVSLLQSPVTVKKLKQITSQSTGD